MPVREANTPRGLVRYSTPEVTCLELVGYPRRSGGLSHVSQVLEELAEEVDAARLAEAASLCPIGWSQRLGYLFESLDEGALAAALAPVVTERAASYAPLRRARRASGASRNASWKLIVNAKIEGDA